MGERSSTSSCSERIGSLSRELGIYAPDVLLPSADVDMSNWPVIACDQYTSSPEYWERVRQRVEEARTPSAYNIILPELYLEHSGEIPVNERIRSINRCMKEYYSSGILTSAGSCLVLTDRATPRSRSRKGLVLAIDLETYEFKEGSNAHIRATEGTVLERIPPRLKIREHAGLEIPHIMLLMDDPLRSVIDPLASGAERGDFDLLYDTELPENGGHIKGWRIPADSFAYLDMLTSLSRLESYTQKGFLFAVGDGNHSLATAKTHWEKIKGSCPPDHPARYAMAELVNIYDEGLTFEPIHRILFGVSLKGFLDIAKSEKLKKFGIKSSDSMSLDNARLMVSNLDSHCLPFIAADKEHAAVLTFDSPPSPFAAGCAEHIAEQCVREIPGARVDYIHGDDETIALSDNGTAILLPPLPKNEFFDIIAEHGSLPRKTFSLGEADEKRFYMESRLIV